MTNTRNETETFQTIEVDGIPSFTKELPINTPVIVGNRVPKGIEDLLGSAYSLSKKGKQKKEGMLFSWNLWRRPYAIECGEEKARSWIAKQDFDQDTVNELEKGFIDGKFYLLFDGGHRRELHKKTFPDKSTWDVEVYPVDDIETAYGMFGNIQDKLMKKLSRDLLVYFDLVGGNPEAKQIDSDLYNAGLVNYANADAIHPKAYADDISIPSIPVNGFKTTMKIKGSRRVIKSATEVILEAFKDAINPNERFRINQYVYYGVVSAMVFSPELATSHKAVIVDTLKDIFRKCLLSKNLSVSQQMVALKLAMFENCHLADNVTPELAGLTIYKAVAEYQKNLPANKQVTETADIEFSDYKNNVKRRATDQLNKIKKLQANQSFDLEEVVA